MQRIHMPTVNARYWLAITLASIFGTNMGDLYAHDSGLGIIGGIPVLMAIAAVVFLLERADKKTHEIYYWLVIVIIRTGATNIADYMAGRRYLHINAVGLSVALALVLAALAWRATKTSTAAAAPGTAALPNTDATYWVAMLVAGVFGTAFGDVCSHWVGQGTASIGLGLILAAVLLTRSRLALGTIAFYWLTVAVARSAGTAIGDWIAEDKALNIGLPLSTLLTGLAFVGVLVFWRSRTSTPQVATR
jgi:uncharacterized membrane-anchored protein